MRELMEEDSVASSAWCVIQTKTRKEAQVINYLCSRGIETYYPCVPTTPVNPRAAKTRPYFPGYIFVHVNLAETGESVLQWIPGSVGLVYRGGEPVIVPDRFILKLKRRTGELPVDKHPHQARMKSGEKASSTRDQVMDDEALFDDRLTGEERAGLLEDWFNR